MNVLISTHPIPPITIIVRKIITNIPIKTTIKIHKDPKDAEISIRPMTDPLRPRATVATRQGATQALLNDILRAIQVLVTGMKVQDLQIENARILSSMTSTRMLPQEVGTTRVVTQDREATWVATRDKDKEIDMKIKAIFRPEVAIASTHIAEVATTVEVQI